jgi:acyl-coenzyme A synthetase/AMP-(fatty) acid ligase
MERLPVNQNGKIDRNALKDLYCKAGVEDSRGQGAQ